MKKIIIPLLCACSILLVLLNIDSLCNKIINLLNHPSFVKISLTNPYYKDYNYNFVSNTTDFTPYGKQDLLNIYYTVVNSKNENFTFYCPKVYQDCLTDINTISNDANLLTHLNNFVHPFNSFTSINTSISDSGEIALKINYMYSDAEIEKINTEIASILPDLLEEAENLQDTDQTDNFSLDYNKIKVVHDYIINNTKYDLDNNKENKSFNAYGALFNHLATCNGYTDLMAIFLTNIGYENIKVATTGNNNSEGHVWNAVKINDEWLHLDLTWDDPVSSDNKDYLYHKYFLINTEELMTADSNITSNEHNFDYAIYQELKNS